jgi:hypothetical protein
MSELFETKFTHKQLVEIAYKWVLKIGGVGVAFKELVTTAREIPDVIGFDSWQSILIECKTSRSDFFRDKKKAHKAHSKGMGNWRFICCAKGLIKVSELPEKWGLIYVDGNGKARIEYDCRVRIYKEPCPDYYKDQYPDGMWTRRTRAEENRFIVDMEAERRIMYSALRRLFIKGHINSIYDKQYNRLTNGEILNNLFELKSDSGNNQ